MSLMSSSVAAGILTICGISMGTPYHNAAVIVSLCTHPPVILLSSRACSQFGVIDCILLQEISKIKQGVSWIGWIHPVLDDGSHVCQSSALNACPCLECITV